MDKVSNSWRTGLWGAPLFFEVLLLLYKGAHKKENACKLLFLRYLSCKDAFSAGYGLWMTILIQESCLVLKSEFSVKRNLLEKAFAYTRGSVSFEQKIGQLQGIYKSSGA